MYDVPEYGSVYIIDAERPAVVDTGIDQVGRADFVDVHDPFAFVPFDLYKSADQTTMGHPIDPDTAFTNHVRLADSARSNILGLQGQLWAETLRSTERMEYMAVPRLLSLAERAWAPQPKWAALNDVEHIRPQWLENELRHGVIAFGAGALLAAVALVLVPEGLASLPLWGSASA
jgi:hypothetical protein